MRLVHERRSGEKEIPKGISFILAGNPPEIGGGYDFIPPLISRLVVVQVKPSMEDFLSWAVSVPGKGMGIVAGFLKQNPHLLSVPTKNGEHGNSFPCPRSWHEVADLITTFFVRYPNGNIADISDLIIGCVGEASGNAFVVWCVKGAPNPWEFIENPKKEFPAEDDRLFSLLFSIAQIAIERGDLLIKAWEIISRAARERKDIAFPVARILLKKNSEIPEEFLEPFIELLQKANVI
jgi:hypothetical protein